MGNLPILSLLIALPLVGAVFIAFVRADAATAARNARNVALLTSVTTFFGLTPLLMDESSSAQFLIPMGISLGFGILFATLITLILVPVNIMIADDVGGYFGAPRGRTATSH